MALSFLKTGAASVQAAQQAQAEAEKRKAERFNLWRFFLEKGEECKITFVDGDLDENGWLVPPRWYEHNIYLNGKYGNTFVCPAKTCPEHGTACCICESGDFSQIVAAFTVIDHRTFKSSKDPNKVYQNTRKLLVVKPDTFELLNKIAVKRGGLAGASFVVSRTGEKSPAVGSMFDFIGKTPIEDLKKAYVHEVTDGKTNIKTIESYFVPADYDSEIVFRTNEELLKLGLGKPGSAGVLSPGGALPGQTLNPGGSGMPQLPDYSGKL